MFHSLTRIGTCAVELATVSAGGDSPPQAARASWTATG